MHALLPLRRWQDAISIRALSGSSDLQLAPLQIKESQTFKFCRCLKAPNTVTGFGSRSSNSCFVFHPKIAPETISKGLKSIFQWGVMPRTPLAGTLHKIYYTVPSTFILESHFQNPTSTTDIGNGLVAK